MELKVQPLNPQPTLSVARPQALPPLTVARPAQQPNIQMGKAPQQEIASVGTATQQRAYTPPINIAPEKKQALAALIKRMEERQLSKEQIAQVVKGYIADNQMQPEPEQEQPPGFLKGLAQGIAKPFLRTGASAVAAVQGVGNFAQAITNKIGGDEEGYRRNIAEGSEATDPNREFDFGGLGKVKSLALRKPGEGAVRSFLDSAGTGAELGSYFVGGGAAKGTAQTAFKNALWQATKQGAKGGLVSGSLYGFGSSLQDQENLGVTNTAVKTIESGLFGAATGALVGAGSTLASRGLNKLRGIPQTPRPSKADFYRSGTGKFLMGDDVAEATARLADDPTNVNAFRTGKKTFETIAQSTRQAVDKLDDTSKTLFTTVRDDVLTGQKFPKLKTQKGILANLPKVSELTGGEKSQITKLRNLVMSNKDWTDKGLWSLRNRIDRAGLFRESADYVSSNRAVTQARNYLNNLITENNPSMKKALQTATEDIDLLNKLRTSLIGNNADVYVERTATNLNKIMNKLDDPTQYEATRKLIQELEQRTGVRIVPDLEAAHAASVIKNKTEFPGIENPTQSIGNLGRKYLLGKTEKDALKRQGEISAQKLYNIRQQLNPKPAPTPKSGFMNNFGQDPQAGFANFGADAFPKGMANTFDGHVPSSMTKPPVDPSLLISSGLQKGGGAPRQFTQAASQSQNLGDLVFASAPAPRPGSLAAEAAQSAAGAVTRPAHQLQIEAAINSGNYSLAKRIIDALPDTDPYKQSMLSIIQMYLK